ncbi:MAG: hypothetical protein UT42_C0021G0013 [Candidatus Falkowbacteria bacterium GW2011_GWA2_39_24]|uniref:HTH cro/C1-type domain-containing protein n=1 Tax=Candidatus Falkowbacteria bacterium GW2011_GWA2_39_24 TaxID=1618634 RepID=A0A0G0NEY7_9BACT|nr:MAG: hypothetical protein UT42_C0021G0013 [Candidatus Falkowbacteria bacterium GW2011_GWA2_39_24]
MTKDYYKFIKELRLKKRLSQAEVAEKIGISRSSYIAFEQGKRDLSLAEASKIADFFGISLEEMESGLEPNLEKYKEMILACLRSGGASDGKIPKTKLAKLLYLADFAWFYEKLSSMSGMQYRRLPYGPVPDIYFRALDELENSGKIVVDRKKDGLLLIKESESNKKQVLSSLNSEEKQLIKAINKNWLNKKTEEIVNFTHNQMPYFLCRDDEIIPYELITQENPDNVY